MSPFKSRSAVLGFAAALFFLATLTSPPPAYAAEQPGVPTVHYHTVTVDGVDIFYREAGPADAPVVLLLHGFPTSSHMFRNLMPLLADRYHVIAPDYPGFGWSAAPDHTKFTYTLRPLRRSGGRADWGSSAPRITRCMSWTTAPPSATASPSSIRSASPPSSSRTGMPTKRG